MEKADRSHVHLASHLSARLQPGYDGKCVVCRSVLYDDEDEEAQGEEMIWCQDCADCGMANQQDLNPKL